MSLVLRVLTDISKPEPTILSVVESIVALRREQSAVQQTKGKNGRRGQARRRGRRCKKAEVDEGWATRLLLLLLLARSNQQCGGQCENLATAENRSTSHRPPPARRLRERERETADRNRETTHPSNSFHLRFMPVLYTKSIMTATVLLWCCPHHRDKMGAGKKAGVRLTPPYNIQEIDRCTTIIA